MLEAVALPIVKFALSEDIGTGDITTLNTISGGVKARAVILARSEGVVAGVDVAKLVFREVDVQLRFKALVHDGDLVSPGQGVAQVIGDIGGILKAERTSLNFLQRLSGIATLTRRYVTAVADTGTVILDTRKTTPGMRFLEKFAVQAGGAQNHRLALWDMYLVKDNHIRAAGGITPALDRIARTRQGDLLLEVEIETFDQLREALRPDVDRILIDNQKPEAIAKAIEEIDRWSVANPDGNPRRRADARRWPEVEVSGGITLENIRDYAKVGADYVSIGALTHSAPALDLSLEIEEIG